jgi:hypothetical protein
MMMTMTIMTTTIFTKWTGCQMWQVYRAVELDRMNLKKLSFRSLISQNAVYCTIESMRCLTWPEVRRYCSWNLVSFLCSNVPRLLCRSHPPSPVWRHEGTQVDLAKRKVGWDATYDGNNREIRTKGGWGNQCSKNHSILIFVAVHVSSGGRRRETQFLWRDGVE